MPEIVPGRYIVVFKDQSNRQITSEAADFANQRINSILSDLSIHQDSLIHRYKYALKGFAAKLSENQISQLGKDPRVDLVAPDLKYRATHFRPNLPFNDAVFDDPGGQIVPWGVARIGGGTRVVGKKAWIIDGGIELNHPELNVDAINSESFVKDKPNPNDEDGHGTFIAGIIAAKEDPQGSIIGVAANAQVVAVRVCDDGLCYTSDTIQGVNHAASNYNIGDVANISLGWPVSGHPYIDTALSVLEDAIKTAADDGLMFTIAAGNDAEHADNMSPARIVNQNVWTISAFDENDNFASFSNFGNPPIDFSAPGVDIVSFAIGGGTFVDSGTSFAAPHFAGLLLAADNIATDGTVNNDPDNDPDLIAVNGSLFPSLSVSLSGPTSLDSGVEGTWSADAQNGTGSYTYQWYYKNDSGSAWQSGGSNSSIFSHTFYNTSSDPIYASVRVVVNDGVNDPVEDLVVVYIEGDCSDPMTCPQ